MEDERKSHERTHHHPGPQQKSPTAAGRTKADGTPTKRGRLMNALTEVSLQSWLTLAALISAIALINQFSSSVQKGWRRKA